jgi:hypothetical protein
MSIEQAVNKAIEGGWKMPPRQFLHMTPSPWPNDTVESVEVWLYSTFMDPTFWTSLGKTMGWWDKSIDREYSTEQSRKDFPDSWNGIAISLWEFHWHTFIDHLAEGKTAESFFAELQ